MTFIRRQDVGVPEGYTVGGKPSKATPADMRLAANQAKAASAKPAATGPATKGVPQQAKSNAAGKQFLGHP